MLAQDLHNETLLVAEMQSGNEEAFTLLYRHYSPRLYLNILSMIHDPEGSEELVQELFTRIWQKRSCSGIGENFSGYMYRVALNLVHDHFRELKRNHKLFDKFKNSVANNYNHVEEGLLSRESTETLKKAIDQLTPQQKKVYQLVREEGLTYKKAAEVMNISPFTVKEYLSSTTKIIRRYFLRHADSTIIVLPLLLQLSSLF